MTDVHDIVAKMKDDKYGNWLERAGGMDGLYMFVERIMHYVSDSLEAEIKGTYEERLRELEYLLLKESER